MAPSGMIWTCGALLPQPQRYLDWRYRRVARGFRADYLPEDLARQLIAFVGVVGADASAWIFQWNASGVRECTRLMGKAQAVADAQPMLFDNLEKISREDREMVMVAMRDGGWTTGWLPSVVREMLHEDRHAGRTIAWMASRYGLTPTQARWGSRPRDRTDKRRVQAARAGALLALA